MLWQIPISKVVLVLIIGLKNDDGNSSYANSAFQCLFSLNSGFFQIFDRLQRDVEQEMKWIAFSSLRHIERAKDSRNLLPVQQGFSKQQQQSLCELWEILLTIINNENATDNTESPLFNLFRCKVKKYLTCSVCQWSQIHSATLDDTEAYYFRVPAVLNPQAGTDQEIIDTTDIKFSRVLYPVPPSGMCPNGHESFKPYSSTLINFLL